MPIIISLLSPRLRPCMLIPTVKNYQDSEASLSKNQTILDRFEQPIYLDFGSKKSERQIKRVMNQISEFALLYIILFSQLPHRFIWLQDIYKSNKPSWISPSRTPFRIGTKSTVLREQSKDAETIVPLEYGHQQLFIQNLPRRVLWQVNRIETV